MSTHDQIQEVLGQLKTVRFAVEAMAAQPEKAALNQSRASMAHKHLTRIEAQLRHIFALPASEDLNAHLRRQIGGGE